MRNPITFVASGIANRLSPLVLGTHPHNTIGSFNYTNIRQLRDFMHRAGDRIGSFDTVVDVGAGQLPYFEIFGASAKRYIAVDYDQIISTHGASESAIIQRLVGTAEQLPVDDASADVVLMNQVLEHVNCPDTSFAEAMRIVKPGGHFVGSVPHVSPIHLEPYDFRRYTLFGVRQLLQKHGFEVETIEPSGGIYSCAAYMIAMSWMLGPFVESQPQNFYVTRAFWLSPIVAAMNLSGMLADRLIPSANRLPANMTWIAKRPIENRV